MVAATMMMLVGCSTAFSGLAAESRRSGLLSSRRLSSRRATAYASETELTRQLQTLSSMLREPTAPPITDAARAAEIDMVLDRVCALNPTESPGSTAGFGPYAEGVWRVAFAPHITKLSSLAGAKFDPIWYKLDGAGGIESNVRYAAPLAQEGWLSTRGRYGTRDADTCFVDWSEAWWNPGEAWPSAKSEDGAFAPIVSAIGRLGFVTAFANFPVVFLNRDLCVFVFPLSQTRIVAVREGGELDPWR